MTKDNIFEVQIWFDKFDFSIQDLTGYKFYNYCKNKYNDFIVWSISQIHRNSRGLEKIQMLEFVDKNCGGIVKITRKEPEKLKMKVILKVEGYEYIMKYTYDIPWVYLEYSKLNLSLSEFQNLVLTACEAYTTIVLDGGETLST